MLKIGQNWDKIANYPPQRSTKIGTPGSATAKRAKVFSGRGLIGPDGPPFVTALSRLQLSDSSVTRS